MTDIQAFTYGVVTGTNPLMVKVGSSTTSVPLKRLGSYNPAIGHLVEIAVVANGDRVVQGNVV